VNNQALRLVPGWNWSIATSDGRILNQVVGPDPATHRKSGECSQIGGQVSQLLVQGRPISRGFRGARGIWRRCVIMRVGRHSPQFRLSRSLSAHPMCIPGEGNAA
jgi:hypothetical protein